MKIQPVNVLINKNDYNRKIYNNTQVSFEGMPVTKKIVKTAGFSLFSLAHIGAQALFFIKEAFPLIVEISPILVTALSLYILKKSNSIKEEPIELEKNIEFKKAETIEEATDFAKTNFKIKKYKVESLELANWINEALCNINNRFEGKVYMPRAIKEKKINVGNEGLYNPLADLLCISKDMLPKYNKPLKDVYPCLDLNRILLETFKLTADQDELLIKVKDCIDNPEKYTSVEKWMIADTIKRRSSVIVNHKDKHNLGELMNESGEGKKDTYGPIDYNYFQTIYHEMGHVFQDKSAGRNKNIEKWFKSVKSKFTVHRGMLKNHNEFVAEAFAGFMNGERYSKEIEDAFHTISNIRFPDIPTEISLHK